MKRSQSMQSLKYLGVPMKRYTVGLIGMASKQDQTSVNTAR